MFDPAQGYTIPAPQNHSCSPARLWPRPVVYGPNARRSITRPLPRAPIPRTSLLLLLLTACLAGCTHIPELLVLSADPASIDDLPAPRSIRVQETRPDSGRFDIRFSPGLAWPGFPISQVHGLDLPATLQLLDRLRPEQGFARLDLAVLARLDPRIPRPDLHGPAVILLILDPSPAHATQTSFGPAAAPPAATMRRLARQLRQAGMPFTWIILRPLQSNSNRRVHYSPSPARAPDAPHPPPPGASHPWRTT